MKQGEFTIYTTTIDGNIVEFSCTKGNCEPCADVEICQGYEFAETLKCVLIGEEPKVDYEKPPVVQSCLINNDNNSHFAAFVIFLVRKYLNLGDQHINFIDHHCFYKEEAENAKNLTIPAAEEIMSLFVQFNQTF
jgi:hypothetical protein